MEANGLSLCPNSGPCKNNAQCSVLKKKLVMMNNGRSQWPRALRCGCAAARLLWLGFESCRKHGCVSFVSDVRCQVEVSASNPSQVQRVPSSVICLIVTVKPR